jgi:hypothetical protein
VLPLSHDEVVHGKGSILGRMPGDEWQRVANLRAYYGFMWGQPGKKLLFMRRRRGRILVLQDGAGASRKFGKFAHDVQMVPVDLAIAPDQVEQERQRRLAVVKE